MAKPPSRGKAADRTAPIELATEVLVLGGGPAGAWAAVSAAQLGRRVVLVDKGYFGTSGATAPSNTGTWCLPPGETRRAAVERRAARTFSLSDTRQTLRVLDAAYEGLRHLGESGYPFPRDDGGALYIANLRGPDYMRFMRRRALTLGVTVLDHHPALELIGDADGIGGAAGWDRQNGRPWQVRAGAVVIGTGGCAFGERMLGATGLTGDGYLMAAEAGASLSGMEFSNQYGVAPAHSSLNKGLIYRWATFSDADGHAIDTGADRHLAVAQALLKGPVFASLDKADAQIQDWLRRGQPNCFLPFDRIGLDPFSQRFEVTLRSEGTVRGVGGIRLADENGWTGVPGLFAAGDAASREDLTGAISGGGGPNASWAIASGCWAGRAASRFADGAGRRQGRRLRPLGGIGLRPTANAAEARAGEALSADIAGAVRTEMLPIDRAFFRSGPALERSRTRLDALWGEARGSLNAEGHAALRAREAGALLATARWALASALARTESRGMHRRTDHAALDPALTLRLTVRGLDEVQVAPEVADGPRQRRVAAS